MKKIGIISDTHGYIDERILYFLSDRDEIWHGGDWGTIEVSDKLSKTCPVRGVYGNIDGQELRLTYPEVAKFTCEGLKILIVHIGGYPGHYSQLARKEIMDFKPDIFISGHSHITKVMRDKTYNLLHINPGAAGISGFHKVRTLILLEIDGKEIKNVRVVELGNRTPAL